MYFVPILYALAFYAAVPMTVPAAAVGLLAWLHLTFAGAKPRREQLDRIRMDLAFRTLSVKALAVSGDYDDTTYDVHALNTPDAAENSRIRALLRDAAAAGTDGWKDAARRVRTAARRDRSQLLHQLNAIVLQLTAQPSARIPGSRSYRLTPETEALVAGIAKCWGVGPRNLAEVYARNRVVNAPPTR